MRVVSSVLCVLACASAAADPSYRDVKEASAQFQRGRALLAESKYKEACAAFARSQQLDPQHGTLYNLAGCYEKQGMLVSALNAFRDLAARDRNDRRRADADKRAQKLAIVVPRLKITTPGPGWTITLNGVDASGRVATEDPVDPGAYELVATAKGEPAFRTTVTIAADGKLTEVVVRSKRALDVADPFHMDAGAAHPVPSAKPAHVTPVDRKSRRYAIMAMAGGGAFTLIGLGIGKSAFSTWDDAKSVCGDDLRCDTDVDKARANELADRARGRGHAATGLVLGGLALGGFGGWLYWKSTKYETLRVAPGAAGTPAGVTIGGQF